jgi:hypothetical protein
MQDHSQLSLTFPDFGDTGHLAPERTIKCRMRFQGDDRGRAGLCFAEWTYAGWRIVAGVGRADPVAVAGADVTVVRQQALQRPAVALNVNGASSAAWSALASARARGRDRAWRSDRRPARPRNRSQARGRHRPVRSCVSSSLVAARLSAMSAGRDRIWGEVVRRARPTGSSMWTPRVSRRRAERSRGRRPRPLVGPTRGSGPPRPGPAARRRASRRRRSAAA